MDVNQLCSACYSGCAECTDTAHSTCSRCNVGFFLYETTCVSTCYWGWNDDSDSEDPVCSDCHDGCY